MRVMENDILKVQINDFGAELCSVQKKENGQELIWNADKKYWGRHAPVLFPKVGAFKDKKYTYQNKEYSMGQHGFARDMEFVCTAEAENKLVHVLCSTEETKKSYPFDFRFEAAHILKENILTVEWCITNTGNEDMLFSVGGHPGFALYGYGEGESYYLNFFTEEPLKRIQINMETGLAEQHTVYEQNLESGRCEINEGLFEHDALIYENNQVKKLGIEYSDGRPYITLNCEKFPDLGIWKKPEAPFLCIEPWYGRCDNNDTDGRLESSPGVITLQPKQDFRTSYSIEFYA